MASAISGARFNWRMFGAVRTASVARIVARGVKATEVGEQHGPRSFAFCDPEDRWFAVTR